MNFAKTYFNRFNTGKQLISGLPEKDLFLSIVIPAYNENELCKSLQSIKNCLSPEKSTEVIVIINSSEKSPSEIIQKNKETYKKALSFARKNNDKKLKFHILNIENMPAKYAGVGLARKTGMDEALRRFDFLNKPEGIIAGFDADALAEKNYLIEIEKYFSRFPKTKAASINFEHPLEGSDFSEKIYKNIINYELHLRYFVEALRFANFPFAYHTIGSSFVVRADIYAKQGGMNRKKAGEDFYFLQKIIPLGNYGEINDTKIIPSPRLSDRVPFGTGAAISKMIENNKNDFGTYNLNAFFILKDFFNRINNIYENFSYRFIPQPLTNFLKQLDFENELKRIKKNSPDIKTFTKNFFLWFNAFRVIKFLNHTHEKEFEKQKVKQEAVKLLKIKYPHRKIFDTEKELLLLYRKIQTENIYNTKFRLK